MRFKKIVDMPHRHILVHAEFLDDGPALTDDLLLLQLGIHEDIAHDIEGNSGMRRRHLGIIPGTFLPGEGIVLRSDSIELRRDIVRRRPLGGPLEHHVLKEVRDAILLPGFIARPDSGHHEHRHRLRFRHRRQHDAQPVFQSDFFVLHITSVIYQLSRAHSSSRMFFSRIKRYMLPPI